MSGSLLSRSLVAAPPLPPPGQTQAQARITPTRKQLEPDFPLQPQQEGIGEETAAYRLASSSTTDSHKSKNKMSCSSRSRSDSIQLLRSNKYKGDITRLLDEEEEEEEGRGNEGEAGEEEVEVEENRDRVDSHMNHAPVTGSVRGNANGVLLIQATEPTGTSVAGHGTNGNKPPSPVDSGASSRTLSMAFTSRSSRMSVGADGIQNTSQEELTDKAVTVVQRVLDKLTGLDFQDKQHRHPNRRNNMKNINVNVNDHVANALDISEQVDLLIKQATSNDNLSTCFIGWCAFW